MIPAAIALSPLAPLKEIGRLCRLIERYDFDRISISENLMLKPAWPVLALVAEHTKRVQVGPMVVSPFYYHPALIAENIALIDEISEKRAFLGIGRGAFLEMLGIEIKEPILAVREAIQIVKNLLAGLRGDYRGRVFRITEQAFLRWKPPRKKIPIIIGAQGLKMAELAGEVASGLDTGFMINPDHMRSVKDSVEKGARQAGRNPGEVEISFGAITSISSDRGAAIRLAKRHTARFITSLMRIPGFPHIEERELRALRMAVERGDGEAVARAISDETIGKICIAGTPQDVIGQIEGLIEAGANGIGFVHPLGPDREEAVKLIGGKILPYFKGSS